MSLLSIEHMLSSTFPAREAVSITEAAMKENEQRKHAPAAAKLVDTLNAEIRLAAELGEGKCLVSFSEESPLVTSMAWEFLRSEGYAVKRTYTAASGDSLKRVSFLIEWLS